MNNDMIDFNTNAMRLIPLFSVVMNYNILIMG